jgi:hypothetical protein
MILTFRTPLARVFLPALALAVSVAGASTGCRRGAPQAPPGPTDIACRPLEPDEEVEPAIGTSFVIRQHTLLYSPRSESVTVLRWRVVNIIGKKYMAHCQATVGAYTGAPSEAIEILFNKSLPGKGDLEVVAVPAGRFRCRRTMTTSGDTTIESWSARGLPSAVNVRQVTRTSKAVTTSELIRIDNASIARPPPRNRLRPLLHGSKRATR